jgi:putative membrane protein
MKVASESSLNHSMNSALKHYSSMFFLPSLKKAIAGLAVICIGIVGFSTFALFRSVEGIIAGFLLGVALFGDSLVFDYVVSEFILRDDPIYVPRRTVALSLFGWVLWVFFVLLGAVFGLIFNILWWIKVCLLGFAALLTLRSVVFLASSSEPPFRRLVASFVQPFSCLGIFFFFWWILGAGNVALQFLPFLIVAPMAAYFSGYLLIFLLDQLGKRTHGMPAMPLFRAFMLNWVVGLNEPFEEFLDKLGENADVEVSLLKFDSSKPKASVIVPLVHPGPFKNIGSSLLPSLLKFEFERRHGCVACVPLGILGHELDLSSQRQNRRVIAEIINSASFKGMEERATPFVKVVDGFITASCQVFGKTALLSFSLSPRTTEDLPQELGQIVRGQVEMLGLECVLMINAHNCLEEGVNMEAPLRTLEEVSFKCLKEAVSMPSYPFEVGASTIFPKEFALTDGMGSGGITVIVIKVKEQKAVYVIIDGNNVVVGLRERILQDLQALGFQDGEVFTTDTHAVSAVVLGRRGYHPVGEAMDHGLLTNYIQQAAKAAEENLEVCRAGCLRLVVPGVRMIGKARLESLSLLVDEALQRAKRVIAPIFAAEGLGLILLLAFL